MLMDNLFEISDYDRHRLKKQGDYVRAVVKPKAEPKG
jgi:hypothetical protein